MQTAQSLFQGTVYPTNLHVPIFKDIQYLRSRFPSLAPYRYPCQGGTFVIIQGPICIRVQGYDGALPLSLFIPQDFPNSPPYVTVAAQNGAQLVQSPALQPNGAVNIAAFFQWVPRQTTIAQLVEAIGSFFDYYPPYSAYQIQLFGTPPPYVPRMQQQQQPQPQQPPQPQIDMEERKQIATAIAESLIEQNKQSIGDAHQRRLELALTRDLDALLRALAAEQQGEEQRLRGAREALANAPLQPAQIDPAVELRARGLAQQRAYDDAAAAAKASFHEGRLTIDQFTRIVRELSRAHFEKHLLPTLQ